MKKILVAMSVLVFAAIAHAEFQEAVSATASSVEGYSAYSGAAVTQCTYSVMLGAVAEGEAEEVIVFLNSDKASAVNESIRLSPEMLPLKQGTLISRQDFVVKYENGILSKIEKVTTEGPFNRDYSLIQVEVSPDLKQVKSGYVKKAVKSLIREKLLGEMGCVF